MNCEQIHTLLESLPLIEFTPQQRDAAEAHASDCSECTKLLSSEMELDSMLKRLPEPEGSPDLLASVMARVEKHDEKTKNLSQAALPIQNSEWPITMMVMGIAMTFCIYGYELLNGRSTSFNLFSLWTEGWTQWLYQPLQLNIVGLMIATAFASYLLGFLLMFRDRDLTT